MFDQIGRLAELTATSLSRRRFVTRLGLAAAAIFTATTSAFASGNCVLNGNGCGGAFPYYNKKTGTCCNDSTCSTCCGGGGNCGASGGHAPLLQPDNEPMLLRQNMFDVPDNLRQEWIVLY